MQTLKDLHQPVLVYNYWIKCSCGKIIWTWGEHDRYFRRHLSSVGIF